MSQSLPGLNRYVIKSKLGEGDLGRFTTAGTGS